MAGYIASTIYPNKGLMEFVEAVLPIAAADSRIRMLIIGNPTDDEYMRDCKERIRKAGLADRAAWIRFEDRIENVYPAMDVVIVPSLLTEGFGMAALEGMLFGKPVVSFASGGLAEIHEATGNLPYLVTPGDIAGLSNGVATLLHNDALREEIGSRNARVAHDLFGLEAFRGRFHAFASALPQPVEALTGLVRGNGPTVYWIEHGRKRPFPNVDSFLGRGFRFEDVVEVPDGRLALLPSGTPMPLLADEPASRNRLPPKSGRGGRRRARSKLRARGKRSGRSRRNAGRRVKKAARARRHRR